MADISQIKTPDGTTYDIKDTTARSGLSGKQATLVSGTNIKTINNNSLLGSGNITISGGGSSSADEVSVDNSMFFDHAHWNTSLADATQVQEALEVVDTIMYDMEDEIQYLDIPTKGSIVDWIYPVGAIYISTSSTNPGTLFSGTTWVQIQDTFLLAAGSTYTAGATGGEATHTLTESELPSVTGTFNIRAVSSGINMITAASGHFTRADTGTTTTTTTNSTNRAASSVTYAFGDDQPHNNMPPYLAVYVWERTA